MVQEVVVTARYQNGKSPSYDSQVQSGGSFVTTDGSGANSAVKDMVGMVMVTTNVTDSTNQDAATVAAKAVADTVAYLETQLGKMNATASIAFGTQGQSITVADLIKEIRNTEFVIDDKSYFSLNGGAGGAVYHGDGTKNQDFLKYHSFDGSPGSYNDPARNDNGQYFDFIILHEFAHLSDNGNASTNNNEKFYSKENPSDTSYSHYTNSDYFINNEKWANDFARDVGSASGVPLSGFNPTYGYGSQTALAVYQSHQSSTHAMPVDYVVT